MKKVGKKISTLIAMTLMLAMLVAMGASAAKQVPEVPVFTEKCDEVPETVGCIHYSESIINTDQDTSLSVYKYSYSGDDVQEGNGHFPPTNLPPEAVPMEGVVFTYLKVADLVHVNDESPVRLEYALTADGEEVFDMEAGQYSSEDLNAALEAADKATLEKYVAENGTDMEPTNEDGVSSATGLDQGLYLVAETQVPGAVYERTNPFLVSLPMTNATDINANGDSYGPGELWQYDVFVFPKNKTEIPSIEKSILDNEDGESEKYESLGVGDTVTYQVTTEVPAGAATMSRFSIADTMSEGLTFTGIESVMVGNTTVNNRQYLLLQGRDAEPYTFILELINDEGNFITGSRIKAGDPIVVTYTAVLNENCVVTEDGNPNHATLIYNHDSSVSGEGGDQYVEDIADPKVYTYGIDLEKVDKDGNPVEGVEFDLYAADKVTQIFVTQKASTNAAYANVNSYYPNGTQSGDKIVTGEDGRAYIWGLAPGTYYLKETKTLPGYTLQKDLIEVKIGEEVTFNEADNENRGTYVPIEAGTTYYTQKADGTYVEFEDLSDYEDGTYINFGTDSVFVDGAEGTYEKVTTYYPTVKADIEVADPFGTEGMNVLLKVLNNAGFDLPVTGGMGTYIFTIGGAVILLAALGLILVRRRRNLAR